MASTTFLGIQTPMFHLQDALGSSHSRHKEPVCFQLPCSVPCATRGGFVLASLGVYITEIACNFTNHILVDALTAEDLIASLQVASRGPGGNR